jgi:hypothetical protein
MRRLEHATRAQGNPVEAAADVALLAPCLAEGERVLWTGRPDANRLVTVRDIFLIPFLGLWGLFATIWEVAVVFGAWGGGARGFALFGLPFFVIGQYVSWGRFVYKRWVRRTTVYALTDKRVLVARLRRGSPKLEWALRWEHVKTLYRAVRKGGSGRIEFGPGSLKWVIYGNVGMDWLWWANAGYPIFLDIPDAERVYATALGAWQQSRETVDIPLASPRQADRWRMVDRIATAITLAIALALFVAIYLLLRSKGAF